MPAALWRMHFVLKRGAGKAFSMFQLTTFVNKEKKEKLGTCTAAGLCPGSPPQVEGSTGSRKMRCSWLCLLPETGVHFAEKLPAQQQLLQKCKLLLSPPCQTSSLMISINHTRCYSYSPARGGEGLSESRMRKGCHWIRPKNTRCFASPSKALWP